VTQGNPLTEQRSLFSDLELRHIRHSSLDAAPQLEMSADALQNWKQRVFQYQQQVFKDARPAQGTLFNTFTLDAPATIDPFSLPPQNIEFWRWPANEPGLAALYFVVDHIQPLLLYIGETCKANQRWKGVHDCKRYVRNYIAAHRIHHLNVSVSIGFWTHAPAEVRPRQRMELELICKWRSPFNKENVRHWGTPFIWGKV
jgi:hypothetical protein